MCKNLKRCGLLVQFILFIASGFNAANLLDLILKKSEPVKGAVIFLVCGGSTLFVFGKLISRESCGLCCKYSFIPWSLCKCCVCCRNKEIKAAKNVRSFWVSWADIYFDLIQAQLLMNCVDPDDINDYMKFLIPVGTLIGFATEIIELIAILKEKFGGIYQLFLALVQAIIGIVQTVLVLQYVMASKTTTALTTTSTKSTNYVCKDTTKASDTASAKKFKYFVIGQAFYMYGVIILGLWYARRQMKKAEAQETTRKSTAQSVELGTSNV
eukprot:13747_1